jgi:hypothetical protein
MGLRLRFADGVPHNRRLFVDMNRLSRPAGRRGGRRRRLLLDSPPTTPACLMRFTPQG